MAKINYEIEAKFFVSKDGERILNSSIPLKVDYHMLERQRKSIMKLIDKSSDEKFVVVTKEEHKHLEGIENMLNDICDFFDRKTKVKVKS